MEQLLFGALWVSACGGLAAVALAALTPLFQKRYSARMRCWVWLAIALCMLVPVRPQLPSAPVRITVPEAVTRTVTLAPSHGSVQQTVSSAAPQAQPEAEIPSAETPPAPQTEQAAPEAPQTEAPAPDAMAQQAQTAAPDEPPQPEAESPQREQAEPEAQPPTLTVTPVQVLGAVWAAGAALSLAVRLSAYFVWKRRVLRACRPLLDVSLRSACARAKAAAGCKTRVRVRVCGAVDTPVVAGVARPMMLLPPTLRADETVQLVLTHEYTHVRRRDVLLKGAAVLAACVHWFNPAVYVMLHGVSRDVELACDEAVLTSCGAHQRAAYGKALIAGAGRAAAFTTQFGGGKRAVKRRLDALFLGARRRGALTALVLAAAVACASVLAACQPAQQDGGSAMIAKPLDTAVPVAQTELPTYTFPLEMWELESNDKLFYEHMLSERGYGDSIVLTDQDGRELAVPVRRAGMDVSDTGAQLYACDGDLSGGVLFAYVKGNAVYAVVTEDGENWTQASVATVYDGQKLACCRVNASTMFIAAQDGGQTGIYVTTDSGASWRQAGTSVARPLADILFFSETDGVLLSSREGDTAPSVLYTTDGGGLWSEASFPDLTQALDMTRIRAMNVAQRDGVLYLQTGAHYKEEQPDGEQFGTFVYTLHSTDGGASWNYEVRPLAERRAAVNATRSVRQNALAGMMLERRTEEDGAEIYYVEESVSVPSLLAGAAAVIRASGGTVELRQEETVYQREVTLIYEGLTDVSVSPGDTVYSGESIGLGTPDGEGTASFAVRISSGGVDVNWSDLYASTDVKTPPLCEVPDELREYADRAGGDRVAVACTLANALLQGDEGAVDDLVFGQYAQNHIFSGYYADDAYRLESLEGFSCTGAWIDVDGEGENARVLLTLDVESAGTTGLAQGLCVYEVESRSEAEEYGAPAGTVAALTPLSFADDLPADDEPLADAVALAEYWRLWNNAGAFNELDADTLTASDVLCAALFENRQSGRTEWTAAELSELIRRLTGVEGYRPQGAMSGTTGYLEWDEAAGVYRLPPGGDTGARAPVTWRAARTDEGAEVQCIQFADGLKSVPAYEYTYHFEAVDDGLALRSCSVDSVTKLTIPAVPVTGEALSDERALAVCRALLDNEARLRAWMFGTNRRVDETDTVPRAWNGALVTYGRSLDFSTAAECAEAVQNVCASAEPLALTGTATRVSDGTQAEIPLCVEENGRLYTAQAYFTDPYEEVSAQGVKLQYVSDERIEFTVPVTLQDGKAVTARCAAVADGGRWTLEALFTAEESR